MGRRSRRFLGRRSGLRALDEGFGLIEVVVAFAVLLAVLVPTALILDNAAGQASTARLRLTALSLAEQCVEKLGNTGPPFTHGAPETGVPIQEDTNCIGSTPVVESTVAYTLHAKFTWTTSEGSHPDLCTSGSVPSVLAVHVWVTWRHTHQVNDSTIIDFPPPGLPTDGFLAVQVNGDPPGAPPADASGVAWSTRVQGVPVTASSTSYTATLHPNSYGCVFQEVPPGSYTVSLADPSSGGVPDTPSWTANADETTAPSQSSLVVNVGLVTLATFQYDEGSFVTLSYPTSTAADGGVVCPAVGVIRCLVLGQAPAHAADPSATPVAELSVRTTTGWTVLEPAGMAQAAAAACAGSTRCVAVGDGRSGSGYAGASVSTSTTSVAFSSDAVPSGVTALATVTCPSSTKCYATGSGSGGAVILSGAVGTSGVSWTLDALPSGVTRITGLSCPAATTCYATTSRGGILSLSGTAWSADSLPTTATYAPSSLDAISCASTTSCYAVGTRKSSSLAAELSLATGSQTDWVKDAGPATLTSLTQLVCEASTSGVSCEATGSRVTGSTPYAAIASLSSPTTWQLDTPTTAASIDAVTCPSPSVCAAIGTATSGAPLLLWKTGASTFTTEPLPSGTAMLGALTCPDVSRCFVTASASTATGAAAALISGEAGTWSLDTLTGSPVAITKVACGGSICEAPAASESGAVFLDGTPTGTAWTAASPPGEEGLVATGVPVAVTNSGLQTVRPLEVAVPAPTATVSRVGPLFPFESGYTVAATTCGPLTPAVLTTSVPGATAAATVPMGVLSLRVTNSRGVPDTSATVTASPSCAKSLSPPAGKTNPASYSLLSTGPLGLSQIALPYGTYKVTVAHTGHSWSGTVGVTPTALVVTGVPRPVTTPILVVET